MGRETDNHLELHVFLEDDALPWVAAFDLFQDGVPVDLKNPRGESNDLTQFFF